MSDLALLALVCLTFGQSGCKRELEVEGAKKTS